MNSFEERPELTVDSRLHPVHACYAASVVSDFATTWTVARQAPLSMEFSWQEYWSGLPCPPPGDLPDPEIKTTSLPSPALAGMFFTISATWEAPIPTTNWSHETTLIPYIGAVY